MRDKRAFAAQKQNWFAMHYPAAVRLRYTNASEHDVGWPYYMSYSYDTVSDDRPAKASIFHEYYSHGSGDPSHSGAVGFRSYKKANFGLPNDRQTSHFPYWMVRNRVMAEVQNRVGSNENSDTDIFSMAPVNLPKWQLNLFQ